MWPIARSYCKELENKPGNKLVITDGVFSMDGDIGPVDKLAALAEKYGAIMMVDDAHASGVLGRNGRGSVDHFGDARQGGCAGGYAVEGHWRAGRICVRDSRLD